jgi:hypothetical protein
MLKQKESQMSTRQRHYGADGEIKFVAHRNLYVGFWGGKVVVTKRTHQACFQVLERDYRGTVSVTVSKPANATVGRALQEYVDRKNKFAAVFNGRTLVIGQDNQAIADSIDCELSPENLSCDGELPRSQVQARYRALTAAATELQRLDPTVKFYEFG